MATIAEIEAAIVSVLGNVTELKQVFDHEPFDITTLPAASIFYSGFNQADMSMPNRSEVNEQWILRIYVQLKDAETAQDEIKAIVKKVREEFRKNRKLNSTVLYNQLQSGTVFAVLDRNNPQLVAELQLGAVVKEG